MNTEDLAYVTSSTKPFGELVTAIENAASKRNFRVLHKHDIQATLAEKGFELTSYTVIEVCNGGFAHTILTSKKDVGMFLPCRIAVYEEEGKNVVMMMKPSLISEWVPGDYGTVPADVEAILKEAVDEAVA